jgi:hypothetical protein
MNLRVSCVIYPRVGPLEFRFEKLALADSDGQVLVVYHAQNGTAAGGVLARLELTPESGCSEVVEVPPPSSRLRQHVL